MQTRRRVVIAEDQTMFREGLRSLLSSDPLLEVVGEAGDGREAIRLVEQLGPDLVLMDLSMPRMHGIESIREIKRRAPKTKIVVLTVHTNEEYILATLEAGANGYVVKQATYGELLSAIKTVFSEKPYLSPLISEKVILGYIDGRRSTKSESSWGTLTAREREILKLIAEGCKNKEIADMLCLSVRTVEKHRANLMRKLNLRNVSSLTAYAIEKGLISQ